MGTYNITPLHIASKKGYAHIAKFLISKGADINANKYWDGLTPLHCAASDDNLLIAKLLVSEGADPNAASEIDETPLHKASEKGNIEIVQFLIENGANVNATNKNGWLPIHFASFSGHSRVAEVLIDNGADVDSINKDGDTPLHLASEWGRKGTVELLLSNGANKNTKNKDGETPLNVAMSSSQLYCDDVARLLTSFGEETQKNNSSIKNLGTFFDNHTDSKNLWLALSLNEITPYIIGEFNSYRKARKALLAPNFMRKGDEQKQIICTEPFNYGFFKHPLGKWRIFVQGKTFSYYDFIEVKKAITINNGKIWQEEEPEHNDILNKNKDTEKEIDTKNVIFDREQKQVASWDPSIINTYMVYKGPNKETALEFLKNETVSKSQIYIVVETPDGKFCKDKMGMYAL
jgi:ankyrin repeat protein